MFGVFGLLKCLAVFGVCLRYAFGLLSKAVN